MERRGEPRGWGKVAPLAILAKEKQLGVSDEQIAATCALAQIEKVGAAAHGDVLAMVECFARLCVTIGTCPATQGLFGFEQRDLQSVSRKTVSRKPYGSGNAGQAAADDDDTAVRARGRTFRTCVHGAERYWIRATRCIPAHVPESQYSRCAMLLQCTG
jgi:hypothetical protein